MFRPVRLIMLKGRPAPEEHPMETMPAGSPEARHHHPGRAAGRAGKLGQTSDPRGCPGWNARSVTTVPCTPPRLFLSVASPRAQKSNKIIWLVYVGAAALAVATITLGIGLL